MGQGSAVAIPLSRKEIRNFTSRIREVMGLETQLNFPILQFLETVMPELDSEFHFEVLSKSKMGKYFGITCPEDHKIVLREDVYLGAAEGIGMHRFTIAHEIAHYFLHNNRSVVLARTDPKEKIPAYKDPEWQADCFAGELLMPAGLIRGMNCLQVSKACGVSAAAARVQLRKL